MKKLDKRWKSENDLIKVIKGWAIVFLILASVIVYILLLDEIGKNFRNASG